MTQPTKPLRALVWSAVSTIEQADDDKFSLDAQVDDARAIADKNGWQVIDTIRIEGHSRNYRTLAKLAAAARSHNEPGFDRLIAHLDSGDFDLLICRDANRFARQASLLYEIAGTIIEDCKARIWSLSDGMIDATNVDIWLMVKGYEIGKQMKWIKGELVRARHKLVDERGLPQTGNHVWSHMKVRDDKGKVIAFVPDPDKADIIRVAARLVIDRLAWNGIENRLFEMGYGNNGKPYSRLFFYRLFTNPWFWGDASRNHRSRFGPNGEKTELWAVDHSAAVPEGVVMHRNVNQPALDGDLAAKLRAEVIRRMTTRTRNHTHTHLFSGLLICKRCGFAMCYGNGGGYGAYLCQSKYNEYGKYNPALRTGCEKIWSISELHVKDWINTALRQMLDDQNPYLLIKDALQSSSESEQDDLHKHVEKLEAQIQRLIEKQSTAPASLADMYDKQIEGLATQRENLLVRIDELNRKHNHHNLDDIQAAFRELTVYETLDHFWAAPEGAINQLLHRLMGNRRLVVLNNKIDGTIEWVDWRK